MSNSDALRFLVLLQGNSGLHSTLSAQPIPATTATIDATLKGVVESPLRPANDRARDRYRHPEASLLPWGLRSGITVVELQPEGGHWTAILAPYAALTGGTYMGGMADRDNPEVTRWTNGGPRPLRGAAFGQGPLRYNAVRRFRRDLRSARAAQ